VREDLTVNAFALPGGFVFVNTGLMSFEQSTKYEGFDADEAAFERRLARPGSRPLREAGEVLMDTLGSYWHGHPETEERIRRVSHTIERSIP